MEKPGLNFTNTNGPKLGNFHSNLLHSPTNNENGPVKRVPLVNGSNMAKENAHTGERTGRIMVKDYTISQENETQPRNASSKSREPLSNLYKNFKIIHDEQTGRGNVQSYQSQENQIVMNTEKSPERIALSNPSIGQLLSESSKQIDKVHKMLEEHRKKRNLQQEPSAMTEEEKRHMSHSKDDKSSDILGSSLGGVRESREIPNRKENILVEDVNQTAAKPHGGFSDNSSPYASSQKYTPLLKDLSIERNSAKKENKEAPSAPSASEIQAQLQQNFNFNMARQESFGKIPKRPSKPSFSENRHNVTAPHVSSSGSKKAKNFYGQIDSASSLNLNDQKGRSSDKSDSSLPIEEKLRLKNENKEKYLQQLRDDRTKNEEGQLQEAPKISQNSINILKNSKWAKENEEVRQKLMSEKKRQKELSPSPEGSTSTKQFKFLKDTPSAHKERNLNEKGSYQKHRENTPKFVVKEPEDQNNGAENSNESSQIREIVKDFTKNNHHIKIVTSNAFHPNILKEDPSIPSSSKSFQTINFGEDAKKVKTVASTDSGFEMESGYTEFLAPTNPNELTNKASNQSQVQLGVVSRSSDKMSYLSADSRPPISPYHKLTIESVTKVSPRIEININDIKALTPTPVSNVPNSKGSQNRVSSEDQKIEIIESNLKRLQNEYIFPMSKSPMNKQTTPEPQARPNSFISSQKESSRNILNQRKTSKQSDDLERLSSPANRPSSIETGRSTESLTKSFQMRQNRLNTPVENKANRAREGPTLGNFHSPNKFQHNVYLNYSSQSKSPIDGNVYNRNNVWLSAKKNKIDAINSHREKEEMKECTFRPALLTKSFKMNHNASETSQNMKPTLALATMESARSNKNFRESLRLAESPSASQKYYQTDSSSKDRQNYQQHTYKQIYETRKSHTPNHNDPQQQQLQNAIKRPFFGHVIKRP